MLVDEISYQISKLLRRVKVAVNHTDRTQVLRTVGVLVIFLSILSVAPKIVEETKEPEVQGTEEDVSSPADDSSEPRSNGASRARLFPSSAPTIIVSTHAAYVIDNETDTVLYEKNPDQRLPMASLTKIMTALVVLENFKLDEIVTVPEVCANLPPNEMGLDPDEKINVENLLYGMLVVSGSDAACALSHHFGGDFLELMNQKARELDLTQTHFENEVGLDGENGNHLSSARDLVKLSKAVLENGVFRKIVGTRQVNIANADQTRWHNLVSTNELLFTLPGITGIKTGLTEQAKGCLAISYERNGREIVGVILGSEDRFKDMRRVLNWIFEAYQWPGV